MSNADVTAETELQPTLKTRRVVTGHDADGRSIILSDAPCTATTAMFHADFVVNEAWQLRQLPADNGDFVDPCGAIELEPPAAGNVFRIVQFPPDSHYMDAVDPSGGFSALGESGAASVVQDHEGHPLAHATNTVDYIVVIQGEIYAVLDKTETLLRQGDVLIQRGTSHAWSNRSDKVCIIAAIQNGANPLA